MDFPEIFLLFFLTFLPSVNIHFSLENAYWHALLGTGLGGHGEMTWAGDGGIFFCLFPPSPISGGICDF